MSIETEVTMPDFEEWATNLCIRPSIYVISCALKQAFIQGKVLGEREGYDRGFNDSWEHASLSDYAEYEKHLEQDYKEASEEKVGEWTEGTQSDFRDLIPEKMSVSLQQYDQLKKTKGD